MTTRQATHVPPVVPLEAAGRWPSALVGGKARGFGTLARAGLPVPEGFVLTTSAYRAAAEHAGAPVRMGGQLRRLIAEALEPLGDAPLAVRSSASDEDGGDRSYAGQYATVLGVRGQRAVEEAVLECWASADGGRASAYREPALGQRPADMAVIVQRLMQPAAAGVVFTADPVTGDRETLVINVSLGLGEAVVSGVVTPDDYRLARSDGTLRHLEPGWKHIMMVWDGEGIREVEVPEALREAPALDDAALVAVHRGAVACEAALGRPVDCEFCVCEGRVVWLQCRPLTALPDAPTNGWSPP